MLKKTQNIILCSMRCVGAMLSLFFWNNLTVTSVECLLIMSIMERYRWYGGGVIKMTQNGSWLRWVGTIILVVCNTLILQSFQHLAVKLFSIVPNSMAEEHTISTITWLNSRLQTGQSLTTLVEQTQIRQWHHYNKEVNMLRVLINCVGLNILP